MEELDEKGFVFIGNDNRPYWCCMYYDSPWFMYWNDGQKSWVTKRKVNQTQIWVAMERKIPDEQAEIYHRQHEEAMGNCF